MLFERRKPCISSVFLNDSRVTSRQLWWMTGVQNHTATLETSFCTQNAGLWFRKQKYVVKGRIVGFG